MITAHETQEILQLEHGFWQGVGPWYDEHMTEHGVTIFPFGILNKQQTMASLGDESVWASHQIDNPRFIEAGDDLMVLAYQGSGVRLDGSAYAATISTTYVRVGESWKLLVHQQSPEPEVA